MLEICQKLHIKLQKKFGILVTLFCIGFAAYAQPCVECNRLHTELQKEVKLRESYVVLKAKNEDYLKKPDVAASAAIKVRSNLMLLGIKIETEDNKIEALKIQKKKLNDCATCPMPKT